MEFENDDADIAILKEVLGDPGRYRDDCEDAEQFENINSDDDEKDDNELQYSGLDLEDLEINSNAPTLRTCRTLGAAYHDMLYITEKKLQMLLERCRAKIKDVQDRMDSIRSQGTMSRNNWYYMFGIPYFKDKRYFPCPPNEDRVRKLAHKELSVIDLPPIRQWKDYYKVKLKDAVKAEEIQNQIKQLKQVNLSERELASLNMKSLDELVGDRKSEYDWMKISVQTMENYFSPEECRAMWHNYLHPMINKTMWEVEEDERFVELVNLHENQDWGRIAEELGTNRSGYQCMCQYQTRLNDKLRKSKWTKEEDNFLRQVVEDCRIGSYIPWAKVTSYMDGRSKNQVFNRWAYSLDPNIKRGRFTEGEDMLVVAAVRRYGTGNFQRVARFLPGRTSIQVRDRYNMYLKYQSTGESWKPDDDAALLALVKQYGEGHWSEISQHFHNRSRTQVRHRFTTIQIWMKKMKSYDGQMFVPTRKVSAQENREEKVWNRVQTVLRNMKSSLEMNESNLLKLKEKLHLEQRKKPGRKAGQKKKMTELEKEYYSFFRCVYNQSGGRRKQNFDSEVTENIVQTVQTMLQYFGARIKIPSSGREMQQDNLLDDSDRAILVSLRDEKPLSGGLNERECVDITEIESSIPDVELVAANVKEMPSSSSSSSQTLDAAGKGNFVSEEMASNITEIPSSQSLDAAGKGNSVSEEMASNITEIPSQSPDAAGKGNIVSEEVPSNVTEMPSSFPQYLDIISECVGNSNMEIESTGLFGDLLSSLEEKKESENDTLTRVSSPQSVSTASTAESSHNSVMLTATSGSALANSRPYENELSSGGSNMLSKVIRTYGKKSSSVSNPIRTYGNKLGQTIVFQKETEALNRSENSGASTSSATLSRNAISNSSESSNLNISSKSVTVSYLTPPNHTTLVGFRTLLLSRRNIVKVAENIPANIPLEMSDRPESLENCSSDDISPRTAASLWKERFMSLFLWPAVMSNIVPLNVEQVFKTEDETHRHSVKVEGASTSDGAARSTKKKKKNIGKKRKFNFKIKKKESKIVPPEKKRKYDRSGKFKTQGCDVLRRSARSKSVKQEV